MFATVRRSAYWAYFHWIAPRAVSKVLELLLGVGLHGNSSKDPALRLCVEQPASGVTMADMIRAAADPAKGRGRAKQGLCSEQGCIQDFQFCSKGF